MCNMRSILKKLTGQEVSNQVPIIVLSAALFLTVKKLQEVGGQRNTVNLAAILSTVAGWYGGISLHIHGYNRFDAKCTEVGNLQRSWRSYTSGALLFAAIGFGVGAVKASSYEGMEMLTLSLAAMSGVMAYLSGLLSVREAEAAENLLLVKKVAAPLVAPLVQLNVQPAAAQSQQPPAYAPLNNNA